MQTPGGGRHRSRALWAAIDRPTGETVTYTANDLDHFAEALDACRRGFRSLDHFNYRLGS